MRPSTSPHRTRLTLAGVVVVALAACSTGDGGASSASGGAGDGSATSTTTPGPSGPSSPSSTSGTPSTSAQPSSPASTSARPSPAPSPAGGSCASAVQKRLTTAQKAGQLLMVGIQPSEAPSGLDATISAQHLGGVIYLGGWTGARTVAATSAHVQGVTGPQSTGGVRLIVAADQEGGQVQQLEGSGFSSLPSALTLGSRPAADVTAAGALVGRELRAAGVNADLAPVADTVPASLGRGNGPIGRFDRQFGSDPATVGRGVAAFTAGLRASRVVATVKHFPGIGRITANTDTSTSGITDSTTSATDATLQPFVSGIRAGAGMVMVSSARYPRLDARNQAVFSRPVITDLLRGRLGWKGVVVTDDVGAARAVSAVPVGERATRFVDAGGDIVLTADRRTAPVMAAALTTRYAADGAFAAKVEASVGRVLALKERMGLLPCG